MAPAEFEPPNSAENLRTVEELSIEESLLYTGSLQGGNDVFYPLGTLVEMHEHGTDTSQFNEIPSTDEVKMNFFVVINFVSLILLAGILTQSQIDFVTYSFAYVHTSLSPLR